MKKKTFSTSIPAWVLCLATEHNRIYGLVKGFTEYQHRKAGPQASTPMAPGGALGALEPRARSPPVAQGRDHGGSCAEEHKAQHRILSMLTSDLTATITELPAGSRRGGAASLRQKHLDAYESLSFPAYPRTKVDTTAGFELPRTFIDADAPLSARKWNLALSLKATPHELEQKPSEAFSQYMRAASSSEDGPEHAPAQDGADPNKRTRRPSAVMRHNVEMAKLMGGEAAKQKLRHELEGLEEKEPPQQLSVPSTRPSREAKPPHGAAPVTPASANPAKAATKKETAKGGGGGNGGNGGGGGGGGCGANGKAPAQAQQGPHGSHLPLIHSVPASLAEAPLVTLNAAVITVLAAGAKVPSELKVSARPQLGVLLGRAGKCGKEGSDGSSKRKRRPPSWFDAAEEDADDADRPAPQKRRRAVAAVTASLSDSKRAAAGHGRTVARVGVLGIVAPRPVRTPSSSSNAALMPPPSSEKSPRPRTTPSSREKHEGSDKRDRQWREREEASEAFQIHFGDLPSPRCIEVVRPKQVMLPGWRILPPSGAGSGGSGCLGVESCSGVESGSEVEAHAGEGETYDTSDAAYERRHARTLERAISAARAVARAMATQERQRHQSSGGAPPCESQRGPTAAEVAAEEWRFRPSELAALCAAAKMEWPEADDASVSDTDAAATKAATAGFFGTGGANRGADGDAKRAADTSADTSADAKRDTAADTLPDASEPSSVDERKKSPICDSVAPADETARIDETARDEPPLTEALEAEKLEVEKLEETLWKGKVLESPLEDTFVKKSHSEQSGDLRSSLCLDADHMSRSMAFSSLENAMESRSMSTSTMASGYDCMHEHVDVSMSMSTSTMASGDDSMSGSLTSGEQPCFELASEGLKGLKEADYHQGDDHVDVAHKGHDGRCQYMNMAADDII